MSYRFVLEKVTANFGLYVDEDDRCKGKIYLPKEDFPNQTPPQFLTLEATPREKTRSARARKAQ